MIVIPGLTQPLKNVGKRIDDWRESDDRLWVEASGQFVSQRARPANVAAPDSMGRISGSSMIGHASANG